MGIKPVPERHNTFLLPLALITLLNMGSTLRVIVCMLTLLVVCQAQCYFEELLIKDINSPPKGCVDKDGVQHAFGSQWMKDCIECSCAENGIACCSKIPDAAAVDVPEECVMVVNKEACNAKVVMKSDKTKECSPLID